MTQEREVQTHAVAGARMASLLSWLRKEAVGKELLFTAGHARRVVEELGFHHDTDAWNVLQSLAKRGMIRRKKRKAGKGIVVSFDVGEPQKAKKPASSNRARKRALTVPQLLSRLEAQIASLEKAIATRRDELAKKKALYNQISTFTRR